jgi:hypothetical protein
MGVETTRKCQTDKKSLANRNFRNYLSKGQKNVLSKKHNFRNWLFFGQKELKDHKPLASCLCVVLMKASIRNSIDEYKAQSVNLVNISLIRDSSFVIRTFLSMTFITENLIRSLNVKISWVIIQMMYLQVFMRTTLSALIIIIKRSFPQPAIQLRLQPCPMIFFNFNATTAYHFFYPLQKLYLTKKIKSSIIVTLP